MLTGLLEWLSPAGFIPHGTCLIWNRGLIWLHVSSDFLIALSYYSIPFALAIFYKRRPDLAYRWMLMLFAAFILACGTTHIFDIITLWQPTYALQGLIKALTAAVSVTTAILMWPVIPKALLIPSHRQLEQINQRLSHEIHEREQAVLGLQAEARERSRLAEQLRKNEARLRTILDTAVEGIVTIDETGIIETCNPAAARMFGYETSEMIGQNVSMLMPESVGRSHQGFIDNYRATGVSQVIGREREVFGRRRDGTEFPVEIALGTFESDGRRFTGILRDITERKRADEALRQSEQRLELAFMGADLGLWDWNIVTGESVFSERWATMLGYDPAELSPHYQTWLKLVHPDDLPVALKMLDAHLQGTTPFYEAEHRLLTKDGQWKWVLSRGKVSARDEWGKPLRAAGTHMDISARKSLEELLARKQSDLLHVQRLTTAGELVGTMSHELNQPLGAIANYLGGITLRFGEVLKMNPELAETIEATLKLSNRAAKVLSGIRNLVRKHETGREWVALKDLVDETLSIAHSELDRRKVRLRCQVSPKLPRIWAQRVHLQQLLLNLILNALEAMDSAARRNLGISAELGKDGKIHLWIRDSGPGIAPELIEEIFKPFVSTKAGGIGLGLSICRTIAEAHSGSLAAEADPEGGTVMHVQLAIESGSGGNHVRS